MSDLLMTLGFKERRGSKPRCHLLTHGSPREVAARLTSLAEPFAYVSADDRWMPMGFADPEEAQLHVAPRLLDQEISRGLLTWWLGSNPSKGRTPNFDLASTCTVDGKPGLLLVEAKAHDKELTREAVGRSLSEDDSADRKASHATIGAAIKAARDGLTDATSSPWGISRDSHYQLSNRFAWSWKLTTLGLPVVLVYLGFLDAREMADLGEPFATESEWEELVKTHSLGLVPEKIWGHNWTIGSAPLVPLIRSIEQPLD